MDKYLYIFKARREYKNLSIAESKSIFKAIDGDLFFSNELVPFSRSIFLREKIEILYTNDNIENMVEMIQKDCLTYEKYKIKYLNLKDKVEYLERLNYIIKLGSSIIGEFEKDSPDVWLALTKIDGMFIFGKYTRNTNSYEKRKLKPYNYSHALDLKFARAVINIAIDNDFTLKLVDPCCGIGTIVTEALDLGLDIVGYDINPLVVHHANKNLEHLGYKKVIKEQNMHSIEEKYDLAFLDLPYGQLSVTTSDIQEKLILKTREISKKAVIITMDDMSELIQNSGFKISKTIKVIKSNSFMRYVNICI